MENIKGIAYRDERARIATHNGGELSHQDWHNILIGLGTASVALSRREISDKESLYYLNGEDTRAMNFTLSKLYMKLAMKMSKSPECIEEKCDDVTEETLTMMMKSFVIGFQEQIKTEEFTNLYEKAVVRDPKASPPSQTYAPSNAQDKPNR
jgi:hypothetical protein